MEKKEYCTPKIEVLEMKMEEMIAQLVAPLPAAQICDVLEAGYDFFGNKLDGDE